MLIFSMIDQALCTVSVLTVEGMFSLNLLKLDFTEEPNIKHMT
jgi:hypothetical protein